MQQSPHRPGTVIECALVLFLAFGYSIIGSVQWLFVAHRGPPISEAGLRFSLIYDVVLLLAIGVFLRIRGWRATDIGLAFQPRDAGMGLLLMLAAYAAYIAMWFSFGALVSTGHAETPRLVASDLNWVTVCAVSVLNPFFEEAFLCGYAITALQRQHSSIVAINVSALVRLLCHLYQGAPGILSIVPVGLINAYWFARTGRLWPLVIAHALMDFVGLAYYAMQ